MMLTTFCSATAALLLVSFIVRAASTSSLLYHHELGTLPESVINWDKGQTAHPSTPYTITITFQGRDMLGLNRHMEKIALSGSAWLTEEELQQYTHPEESSKAAVIDYFRERGIPDEAIVQSETGDQLKIHTTVELVSDIFSTDLSIFTQRSTKEQAVRSSTGFKLPDKLKGKGIMNIGPLTRFATRSRRHKLHLSKANRTPPKDELQPHELDIDQRNNGLDACANYIVAANPFCWRELYGLPNTSPIPSAGSPDLGIVGFYDSSFDPEDLKVFLKRYNPQNADYNATIQLEGNYVFNASDPTSEATLDMQNAVALVAPLNVTFFGHSDPEGDSAAIFTYLLNLPSNERPSVFSMSYTISEYMYSFAEMSVVCKFAQSLTALGMTIVVPTGDWGLTGIEKDAPCRHQGNETFFGATQPGVCPHVLSVGASGGSGNPTSVLPETMVGEGNASTTHIPFWSGAGVSRYFRDEHQAAHAATYIDYLNKTKNPVLYLIDDNSKYRATPDLVAWGADFEEVYQGISYNTTGGASLSTPIVASMLALINSERRKQGRGTIGWVHPVVYSNRAKASAFVDIEHGGVFGCSDDPKIGFPAINGFDFASGLGRPDFLGLAALFLESNVVTR